MRMARGLLCWPAHEVLQVLRLHTKLHQSTGVFTILLLTVNPQLCGEVC